MILILLLEISIASICKCQIEREIHPDVQVKVETGGHSLRVIDTYEALKRYVLGSLKEGGCKERQKQEVKT